MCQSSVYRLTGQGEELVMEDVALVKPEGEEIFLEGLLGEQKRVKGKIKELQLMDHRIIIK